MARRSPRTQTPSPASATTRPSAHPLATGSAPLDPDDDGFDRLGERARRLALGLTAALIVMRPYWPSEDAVAGTGLGWVAATLVVAALAIIAALLGGKARFRWSWADGAFLLLVSLVALSTTQAADRRAAINLAWEWVGLGIIYLLVRNLPRTRGESAAIAGSMAATAAAVAAYGLFQVAFELPALQAAFRANPAAAMQRAGISPGGVGEAMFRDRVLNSKEPFSTFALANSLAGFLVGPLAFGLAVGADNLRRAGRGSRLAALGLAAIPGAAVLLCLLLTKSRSAWIGLLVAGLVIAWRARGRLSGRTILVAAGGLGLVLVAVVVSLSALGQLDRQVVTQSTRSLRFRLEYWAGTWDLLNNRPIPFAPKPDKSIVLNPDADSDPQISYPEAHAFWRGLGPGNFGGPYLRHKLPEASEEIADPHNFLLDVWCTAGLPALVAILATLGLALRQAFRPSIRGEVDEPEPLHNQAPDSPPASAGWLIPWAAAGAIGAVLLGKLNLFAGDLLTRWVVLVVAWVAAAGFGALLWRRRPIPASAAGAAVLAIAINLLAAGGIGMPAVALALWVFLALALNLRDDLRSGQLRERVGLVPAAGAALIWAAVVGAFAGAVVPFWKSEIAADRAEEAMAKVPPAYEVARDRLLQSISADKANVRPWLGLADLELTYWRSPEFQKTKGRNAKNSSSQWSKVFLALNEALTPPWRDPNSLLVRRLKVRYARLILNELTEGTPLDLLSLKQKIVYSLRLAAFLYPTNALLRSQLAQASADLGTYGAAVDEAKVALTLSDLTPHDDKKLPEPLVNDLKSKIPIWTEARDHPPEPPKAEPKPPTK